jgi:hypothetical protein
VTNAELRRLAQREQRRRAADGVTAQTASITAEKLCAGHDKQLALVRDAALYIVVLCSRRAGKTYGLACLALLTALLRPRQNILYIGLSKPHARKFLWNEVWCPLLDALDPNRQWHKRVEDEMTTTFANGSIMYVSGTDDIRHIESFLGNRLNLAIVDEAQSQSDSVLVPLTTRILPNALLDDMTNPGKLIMSGTIPEVEAGRFMEVWKENTWSRHNWNRFENPHLKNQPAALVAYLAANPGLTEESPEVQREWYGRFKFDPSATAYRFIEELNSYKHDQAPWLIELLNPSGPESDLQARTRKLLEDGRVLAALPWNGIEVFGIGLDVGGMDRSAAEVNGWGAGHPNVQHLFDWASPRGACPSWDDLGLVCKVIAEHYQTGLWFYDSNSKTTLDTFNRLYGTPVIQAANKSDFEGQLKLFNTLLTSGRYKAMLGSQLVEDLKKSRLDPDALRKQQYKWASSWHPDPSEAGRYSLRPYFDAYVPPDTRTEADRQREAWTQPLEDVLGAIADDQPPEDSDLAALM